MIDVVGERVTLGDVVVFGAQLREMPKLHNRRTRYAPREAAELNRQLKFPTCHRERRRLRQQGAPEQSR